MTSISLSIYFVVFASLMIHEQWIFVSGIGNIFEEMKGLFLMLQKIFIRRIVSVFLAFCLTTSLLSYSIFADETESSPAPTQNEYALTDPTDGVLDPEPENLPSVSASAFLIYDALSEAMLIGNAYDEVRAPAAITQIMTILLSLEELELSDTITITKEMYETIPEKNVRIGFTEGEVVTVEQCINACLLKSANDACMALAVHISGSEKEFVKKMNDRAKELGCRATNFTNPCGYSDPEHKTTCRDMVLIQKEALRHPDYRKIATSASFTIEPTNKFNDKRILNNANRFISTPSTAYEYYVGGKTGYSEDAGYTIIAGAEKDGRCLIGILLSATDAEKRYQDLTDLFEYCFTNYTTTMVEASEMDGAINAVVTQIENAIAGTNLFIRDKKLQIEDYYTVKTYLANGGYSNSVDVEGLIIDPLSPVQVFELPVNRRFSNNEVYRIGTLTITIADQFLEATPVPKTEEKSSNSIRALILTILVASVLIAILIFAVVLLMKLMKKRTSDKNHRNPTIL